MILATAMIAVIMVLLFTMGQSSGLGTYTIYVKFSDARGVTPNTPVRKSGIRIGRVTDLQFTDQDTAVLAKLAIENGHQLYDNEYCQAVSSLLSGDAVLEFVRDPNATAHNLILPGEKVEGRSPQDPARAFASFQQGLAQSMNTVEVAGRDVHNTLNRVDRLIATNEKSITEVIAESKRTLLLLQVALNNANELLGDQQMREQIRQTIAAMPLVVGEARATVAKAGVTIDKATVAMDKAQHTIDTLDENLRNLEGLTKPLGEKGDELVTRLDEGVLKFNGLMDELNQITKTVNDPNGTVGLLLHDPELYNRATHIARNVEKLTMELQPILDDARVFSDKLARDGLRGILGKSDHLKGKPASYNQPLDQTMPMGEQIFPYDPE